MPEGHSPIGVDASLVLETAHEAFVAMDADGMVTEWNRAAEETFGWSRDEAVGSELAELIIPPDLRPAHRAGLARFIQTGEGPVLDRRLELPAIDRNGDRLEIEITISAPHDPRGGHFFHAFLHDIRDRRRGERLLATQLHIAEALATAHAPEQALTSALEGICSAGEWVYGCIWQAGPDTDLLFDPVAWWDPAAGDLSGFERAGRAMSFYRGRGLPGRVWATGEPVWVYDVLPDPDFPRNAVATRLGIRAGLALPLRSAGEVVGVMELFAARPRVPDRPLMDMLESVVPQLAQYMLRTRAERQAQEMRDAFVATVSHELRTPVTAIAGFAQTLLDLGEQLDDDQQARFLRIIREQSARLAQLVEDLLDMSRLQTGSIAAKLAPTELGAAVREALHELGEEDVDVVVPSGDALAMADRDLFKQIVVNFVTNARRYGEPPLHVHVQAGEDQVEVRVSDEGPGVAPEFVPRLFDKFERAPEVAHVPGTGLGLAIVKALAELQEGVAFFEPNEPRGARFGVRLPRASGTPHVPG